MGHPIPALRDDCRLVTALRPTSRIGFARLTTPVQPRHRIAFVRRCRPVRRLSPVQALTHIASTLCSSIASLKTRQMPAAIGTAFVPSVFCTYAYACGGVFESLLDGWRTASRSGPSGRTA